MPPTTVTPSAKPLMPEDAAVRACTKAILAKTGASTLQIEGSTRVATCVAREGYRQEAILVLTAALHNDDGSEAISPERALALKKLADLEFAAGDIADARRHIAAAYASVEKSAFLPLEGDYGIAADFKRISPQGLQSARQVQASAFARDTAGLSTDERSIYAQMGWPDHVETYTASGYTSETWWYGKETYFKAFTFTNGALTSTYDP
jgi:hypothetical protein